MEQPNEYSNEHEDRDGVQGTDPNHAGEGAGSSPNRSAEGQAAGDEPAAGDPSADDLIAEAEEVVASVGAALEQELEAARKESADWQDKYVRLHAEWDTYRRRMSEQREEEKLRANEKLVGELIPLLDDFERTIAYAEANGEAGLLEGVRAVSNKLFGALCKTGLEVIDPVGEAFDALSAQAVGTVEDATVPDETVAQVYQKGYRMGKKVLRSAMVTITSGGPKREKPETEE